MSTGFTHGEALLPGTRLREFELVDVLGRGGFGVTYKGWDTIHNIAVAVKEYMPFDYAVREPNGDVYPKHGQERHYVRGLSEFLNEARMLAGFSHPNIVRVLQFFEGHGTAYMVMEYLEGQTLYALFREQKTLGEARLRALLGPILAGLQQVHDADWLHLDIKPGNIVLRDAHTPVLIDFGAAQEATAEHGREERVVAPGFSPLEQYGRSGRRLGPWTDLYAVAAVLYQGMTEYVPNDALARERNDDLDSVGMQAKRRYGRQLTAAVDWALKLHAEDRPQSIDEWRDVLDQPDDPPLDPPPSPPPPGWNRWLVVLVMVVMLIVSVIVLW